MTTTEKTREVRRQLAVDFFRRVKGRDFEVKAGPFGFGFTNTVLMTLHSLCMHFPPNITYITNGGGLETVELEKLRPHAQEVDMAKILASVPGAEVVLFGEEHGRNINAHSFVRGAIQVLGAEGFRAYGVEVLRVEHAELTDGFNRGGIEERAALEAHIKNPMNTGSMARAADTHMEIFDAAKEAGVKVYPLTHPSEWDFLTIAPRFPFGSRLIDEPRARDCFMSLAVNYALVEQGKAVLLTGLGHIDVNNGLPSVLKYGFGYKVVSIALVERIDITEPFMVRFTQKVGKVVPVCRTLSWSVNDAPPKEADWIIFFPHVPRGVDHA